MTRVELWTATETYVPGEHVIFGGTVFVATRLTTGDTPVSSPDVWAILDTTTRVDRHARVNPNVEQ